MWKLIKIVYTDSHFVKVSSPNVIKQSQVTKFKSCLDRLFTSLIRKMRFFIITGTKSQAVVTVWYGKYT